MHFGALISAILHVIVIVFVVMGLPNILQSERTEFVPMVVEVVTPDVLSPKKRMKSPPNKKPIAKALPTKKKPVPKIKPRQQAIKPPEAPSTATVKPLLSEKEFERIPKKKLAPKPKIKPKSKTKPKAAPRPKQKPKKITVASRKQYLPKPKRKPKPALDALSPQSLLKNLAEAKPIQKRDISRVITEALKQTPQQLKRSPLDQRRLEAGLAASIMRQLFPCYSILSGAKGAENMRVTVKVRLNPDGSLGATPRVTDATGIASDGLHRAAKESALRTLQDPTCMPLKLPYDHYDLWKETTLTFDPKEMLRQ